MLRRLRANPATRLTPVVVFSSSAERADVATAYELGANSYVTKPIDARAFSRVVQELGLYWLQDNLPPPRAEDSPDDGRRAP